MAKTPYPPFSDGGRELFLLGYSGNVGVAD